MRKVENHFSRRLWNSREGMATDGWSMKERDHVSFANTESME